MKRAAPDPALPPATALRLAALQELERAQTALGRGDARGVHQTRKSIKRLRAYTRLLRDLPLPAAADRSAQALNALLRATAHALEESREATVALDTFGRLKRPVSIRAADWRALGQRLRRKAETRRKPTRRVLDTAGAQLEQARETIAALPDSKLKPADLRRGLRKSCKRARKAFRELTSGNAEALHEWRKRAKRLEAIQALLDPLLDAQAVEARSLDELTELLGLHHDLHVLPQHPGLTKQQREWLVSATRAPAAALERRVRQRGKKLFG